MFRRFAGFMVLAVVMGSSHASVIFEDDFDADATGIPVASLINWNINTPSIDVVGPGTFGYLCADGSRCLDMDGTPGNGSMTTKLSFNLAAGDYLFSFDYGNNAFNNNSLDWTIGSQSGGVTSGVLNNNTYTSSLNSFTLAGAESGVFITFASGGPTDNGGTILDNVKLELVSAVGVPAPAPLALLLMGLAVISRQVINRR